MAEDIAEFVGQLQVENADVFGYSMGAYHRPLSWYVRTPRDAGFVVSALLVT